MRGMYSYHFIDFVVLVFPILLLLNYYSDVVYLCVCLSDGIFTYLSLSLLNWSSFSTLSSSTDFVLSMTYYIEETFHSSFI